MQSRETSESYLKGNTFDANEFVFVRVANNQPPSFRFLRGVERSVHGAKLIMERRHRRAHDRREQGTRKKGKAEEIKERKEEQNRMREEEMVFVLFS